ncbi:1170_t:CDS:1, partial [Funneliformis mosseae]
AFSWSLGDIIEVNIKNNNYEQAKIITTNLDYSKFIICLLDSSFSNELQVDYSSLRLLMPIKLNWKINDYCEFKSPKDNK